VVSDFELVTMMIKHARPEFTCQHGTVVSSPDAVVVVVVVVVVVSLVVVVVVVSSPDVVGQRHGLLSAVCTLAVSLLLQ